MRPFPLPAERYYPPIRTETDWYAVLAAALCGVVVAMNIGKVPIAMSQLRAEFGLSLVAAVWVSSTINTLAISMALLFGVLCDRLGALRMCLTGLGFGILGGLGMLLAPALMPFWGWHGIWVLILALLLIAALAVYRSRPAYRPLLPAGVNPFAGAKAILAQREPWLLAFDLASFTIQHFALIIWLPTFLQEQRGLSPLAVSLLSCVMVLANVPGNLLGGSLLQRNFRRGSLIAFASAVTGLCGAGIFRVSGLGPLCLVRAPVLHRRLDSSLRAVGFGQPRTHAQADRHTAGTIQSSRQHRPILCATVDRHAGCHQRALARCADRHRVRGGGRGHTRCHDQTARAMNGFQGRFDFSKVGKSVEAAGRNLRQMQLRQHLSMSVYTKTFDRSIRSPTSARCSL